MDLQVVLYLSFPRRRESSPEKALEERQIEQYLLKYLCHPYGILKVLDSRLRENDSVTDVLIIQV